MNNYFGQQYNPYLQPQQNLQKQEVIRVNGENGARAYNLPPNSSVLMLDNLAPIVWLKVTDGASYPTLTAYEISPIETAQTSNEDYKGLEERIKRLEEMLDGKSDTTSTKSKASGSKQNTTTSSNA